MKEFNLVFSKNQIEILNKALIELPFREVAELIDSLNKQLTENKEDEVD